jgi:hypothetical protein
MIFKHFLATRFNIRIGPRDTTKNGETLLDDSWMDNRFKLFENYSLPFKRKIESTLLIIIWKNV